MRDPFNLQLAWTWVRGQGKMQRPRITVIAQDQSINPGCDGSAVHPITDCGDRGVVARFQTVAGVGFSPRTLYGLFTRTRQG